MILGLGGKNPRVSMKVGAFESARRDDADAAAPWGRFRAGKKGLTEAKDTSIGKQTSTKGVR